MLTNTKELAELSELFEIQSGLKVRGIGAQPPELSSGGVGW